MPEEKAKEEKRNDVRGFEKTKAGTTVSKERDKVGLPPGTLMYVDDDGKDAATLKGKSIIRLMQYNESLCEEKQIEEIEEIHDVDFADKITWIHVAGLWQVEIVRKIGEQFEISPLILEDLLNMEQRPKTEEYETYFVTILKQIRFDAENREIRDSQIGLITFDKIVLTFCENDPKIFKSVTDRIQNEGRIRKYGADYLTYALVDVVVDQYFNIVEEFEEWMDDVEKRIIRKPDKSGAEEINKMRHELTAFKRAVWPLITAAEKLEKSDSKIIKKSTRLLFRDVFDHVVRITESIEADHEILTGIYDLYSSGISNRLNDTMRILTVISTIFIPLTFIAGIYGMNFDNMPALHWKYGYYLCLGLMGVIFLTMILFFKKKEWI